jgi:hypothetical protein
MTSPLDSPDLGLPLAQQYVMRSPELSIVVPTYNESANIQQLVNRLGTCSERAWRAPSGK